jgi:hypothetical protein
MTSIFRNLIIAAMFTLGAGAQAADPTGSWRLDEDSVRSTMSDMMEQQLAGMDEQTRQLARGMMQGMVEQMVEQMAGTATFSADGTVVFNRDTGGTESGRWEDLGDSVRVIPDNGEEPGELTVDGDQLVFEEMMQEMEQPLRMVWLRQ